MIVSRQRIWPPAGQVYASLGLGAIESPAPPLESPVGDGLELREIIPSRGEEGGVPYLVLDGQVVNVSEEIIEVPQLLAVVRDSQNVALHEWVFRTEVAVLAPGESAAFRTRVAEPANTASDVKIEFTEGQGGAGAGG